jgi:acetylornithine deacetylase/succinyl-diaminopimelate desuccinylase-like protein
MFCKGDGMSDVAVNLLSEYIRLNTSNPPGNEHLAAAFFSKIFQAEGIGYKTYEYRPGRTSIRAEIKGSGKKKPIIMLHHTDVVPANREEWSFDPFGGEVIGDHICGRGALDTKCLGIMQLLAMLDIRNYRSQPDCDLVFLATADEESGADCGVEFLLREYPDDFKAGLLLNEGSYVQSGMIPDKLVALISPGEKGPCWFRLKRKGIPGHGSTPHDQNPLERLTAALSRLLAHKNARVVTPIVAEYFRKLAEGLDYLKPYAADGKESTLLKVIEQNGLMDTPRVRALLQNTISLNSMHSGSRVNVIPSYAEAEVDTRLLPGQNITEWVNFVRDRLADTEIEMEFVSRGEGNSSDSNTESYHTIEKVLEKHYPGAITAPFLMLGATDSRFFREKGVLSYGFCPAVVPMDDMKSVHGIDEKIRVGSMIKGTEVYKEIIRRLCLADE